MSVCERERKREVREREVFYGFSLETDLSKVERE